MSDDLLAMLADLDSPVTDTLTGERVARYARCPDCNQIGWGTAYNPNPPQSVREAGGWRVTSTCRCGRLAWDELSPRDWQDRP